MKASKIALKTEKVVNFVPSTCGDLAETHLKGPLEDRLGKKSGTVSRCGGAVVGYLAEVAATYMLAGEVPAKILAIASPVLALYKYYKDK